MKVLMIHPSVPVYGGAEHLIVEFGNYLSRQGVENALLTTALPDGMEADFTGTEILKVRKFSDNPLEDMLALCRGVGKYSGRFDVINPHNFPASIAAACTKKPSVWMCNEPPELFTSWERKFLEAVNRHNVKVGAINKVVVADLPNARRFFDLYGVTPEVIPYGIDYPFFAEDAGWSQQEAFTIVQVGVIQRFKNQVETLKALGDIKDQISPFRLFIVGPVGEADYCREVERAVDHYGLGGRVLFTDNKTRKYIRFLYRTADVLVHPCGPQGGWLTPFEALSSGVPIIVKPELSCSSIIKDNDIGQVTDDLAQAILNVHLCPMPYRKQALLGKQWVKDNLSWDKFGAQMVGLFEEVIGDDKDRASV